jgi:hypothetical protein
VDPVFCREIKEGEENFLVLGEALTGLEELLSIER